MCKPPPPLTPPLCPTEQTDFNRIFVRVQIGHRKRERRGDAGDESGESGSKGYPLYLPGRGGAGRVFL